MAKKKTLVGVCADPQPRVFSDVKAIIKNLNLKEGTVVGVEYSLHHFYRRSVTEQDIFWKKLINHLQGKKCRIVFFDSEQLRTQIDLKDIKGEKLTLADAKKMFNEREKVFMQRIPECEVSFLGSAHAIRLQKKAKANLVFDPISLGMHQFNLIPLSANQMVSKAFNLRRQKIIKELAQKIRIERSSEKIKKPQNLKQKRCKEDVKQKCVLRRNCMCILFRCLLME